MTYETLSKRLSSRYECITRGGITLYLQNSKIVATQQKNIIVLYFECDRSIIQNEHDIATVAIAKDFELIFNYRKVIADVVVVDGMCGTDKTFIRRNNRLLQKKSNLFIGEEDVLEWSSIGTVGYTEERGIFKFYNSSITIYVPENMCEFSSSNLNYCVFKQKKNKKNKDNQKIIQKKDYDVFEVLKNERNWDCSNGFYTKEGYESWQKMKLTKTNNFHKVSKATIVVLK